MVKLLSRTRNHRGRTKSQQRKAKRDSHTQGRKRIAGVTNVFTLQSIKDNWDPKSSRADNYARLGLLQHLNDETHSQHDTLKQFNQTLATTDNDSQLPTLPPSNKERGLIIDELNQLAAVPPAPKNEEQRMNLTERARIELLVEKYGDDTKRMARDIKINQAQLTQRQLEKRIVVYNRLNDPNAPPPVVSYFAPKMSAEKIKRKTEAVP